MKHCPKCLNLSPDTSVACNFCGTVLDDSVIARAQGPVRGTTLVEPSESTVRPSPPPPVSEYRPSPPPSVSGYRPSPPPPASGPPLASGRRGETIYAPPAPQTSGGSAAAAAPHITTRKAIGVLVTYSWKPEGQLFPVREGRNLIGRGEECEIRVTEDPAMSQVNSHITFRQSFVVGDMVSMSGTYLNGEPVEEQFRLLKNYAQIRAGSTLFTFVILDPAAATA